MKWVIDLIQEAMQYKFYGSIQINFYAGGITNVTKTESIKPPQTK